MTNIDFAEVLNRRCPLRATFVVHLDLPGVSADSIDLTVEQNVLTIQAERKPLGDDGAERVIDRITAGYEAGVLTPRIPIAEGPTPARSKSQADPTPRRSPPDSRVARHRAPGREEGSDDARSAQ